MSTATTTAVNVVAWVLVGVFAAWLLVDFVRTNRRYDEEYLTTSIEGVDEFAEVERAMGSDGEGSNRG